MTSVIKKTLICFDEKNCKSLTWSIENKKSCERQVFYKIRFPFHCQCGRLKRMIKDSLGDRRQINSFVRSHNNQNNVIDYLDWAEIPYLEWHLGHER